MVQPSAVGDPVKEGAAEVTSVPLTGSVTLVSAVVARGQGMAARRGQGAAQRDRLAADLGNRYRAGTVERGIAGESHGGGGAGSIAHIGLPGGQRGDGGDLEQTAGGSAVMQTHIARLQIEGEFAFGTGQSIVCRRGATAHFQSHSHIVKPRRD